MTGRRWVLALLSVLLMFLTATPASAACHAFTVAVTPAAVDEGDTVRITVSRDAAVNPSSVHVSTIDESARAGSDYVAINETVSFTNETSKTLTLQTMNDSIEEPAESLRLHLSNPGGCAVNPNFSVGPDAQVTIKANDAATTTVPPATTTLAAPGSTNPASTTVPPTVTEDETTTSGVSSTTDPEEDSGSDTTFASGVAADSSADDDGGVPVGALLAGAAVLAAAAGVGTWLLRRRSA